MLAWAAIGIAAALAQFAFAGNAFFHTWQYATLLAIAALFALRYGTRGRSTRGMQMTLAGALLVVAGGFASGLLGADTQTIVRSPGVVAPIPDVDGAAFFPIVDAASMVRPEAIVLRRRGKPELAVAPGSARYVGASILSATPRVAAYIEARDAGGNRVTITQPTNVSFLSPVILFTRSETLEGELTPTDSFAIPAAHRFVRVLYFSPARTATFKNAALSGAAGKQALLFAMTDERGDVVPGQIGLAQSGQEVTLDRLRIRATIGSYPSLGVASAPHPLPCVLGALLFLGGFMYSKVVRTPAPAVLPGGAS